MDAQGALDSLLGRLTSILVEEAQLLGRVRGDVEFIKDEMECMNSLLLQLTEAQHRNYQVRTWMKQVVGLTRDCGGNVELYIHYVGGATGGSIGGLLGRLRRIPQFLRTITVRHRIATRIKELKVRARDVGDRRQRYGVTVPHVLTGGATNLAASVACPLHSRADQSPEEEEEDLRRRDFLYGEPPDTIQEGTNRILGWMSEVAAAKNNNARCRTTIMVIQGEGSVGKTAIAMRVYRHPSVVSSFQFRAWVNFGGAQRHLDEVRQEILEQTLLSPEWRTSTNEEMITQEKADRHIRGKTCLIVLDGIPGGNYSYAIRDLITDTFPDYVLVTLICTTHYSLFSTNMYSYVFRVHHEETLPRFYRRRALALASCSLNPLDQVLTECYPDAFALQMFLHLLYVNPKRSERELIILRDLLQQNKDNIAKTMLMFCYDKLPINYKSCLLYLSIFPKDHIIRRTSLLRRWIAEGLIAERSTAAREKDQVRRSLEDQAELIFDALVARGFVCPGETSSSGKVKNCTVHHIVQEFITTDVSLADTCLPSRLAYRVSINNGIALQEVFNSNEPSNVTQTLLEYMPQSPQWQLLKVLDLEGCTGFKKRHLKNICKVLLLKYLSLKKTDVTELPKQIEKLQCLETLDIRQTKIRVLSKSFMLPVLKYFLAGHRISPNNRPDRFEKSFEAVRLPSGIRRMKRLEVMSHVEVYKNVGDLIDIGQLMQLRKLGVVLHITKGVLDLLFQQIEKLHGCLRSLSIRINQQISSESSPDAEVVPALVNPPKLLESLNIYGIKSGLPDWVADLDRLSKITLQDTPLGEDSIHILGKLRMLRGIKLLHNSYTESKLSFKEQEFQRLRFLVIEGTNISTVSFDNGAAPKLEMIVWSFFTLEALSGINHLPKLKKLELNGDCNLDPVKEAIEMHPNHPELHHNQ